MNLYIKYFIGVIFSIALVVSNAAFAIQPTSTSGLVGTWYSVNPNTRGTVKVIITKNSKGKLFINTFGSCSPTPCNHGKISALKYSRSISSNYSTGLTAKYDHGFKTTKVDAYRDYSAHNGIFLRLNTFNQFASGDSRKDYYSSGLFRK